MTRDEAETLIRSATAHDTDTRVSQAQIQTWLLQKYQRFRRKLTALVPSLYSALTSTQALTTADPDFDLPADYERVIRFQIQVGSSWIPVEVANALDPEARTGYVEEAGVLRIHPASDAAGTYRLLYTKSPNVSSPANYTIEVPAGCEEIITHEVCAEVITRAGGGAMEDPAYHLQQADRIWADQRTALRRRYGAHVEGGLRIVEGF